MKSPVFSRTVRFGCPAPSGSGISSPQSAQRSVPVKRSPGVVRSTRTQWQTIVRAQPPSVVSTAGTYVMPGEIVSPFVQSTVLDSDAVTAFVSQLVRVFAAYVTARLRKFGLPGYAASHIPAQTTADARTSDLLAFIAQPYFSRRMRLVASISSCVTPILRRYLITLPRVVSPSFFGPKVWKSSEPLRQYLKRGRLWLNEGSS